MVEIIIIISELYQTGCFYVIQTDDMWDMVNSVALWPQFREMKIKMDVMSRVKTDSVRLCNNLPVMLVQC